MCRLAMVGLGLFLLFFSTTAFSETGGEVGEAGEKELSQALIPVSGMKCGSCSVTVTKALETLPGIASVQTDLKHRTAFVTYDPEKVTLDQIIDTINGTGFKAERPKF